MKSKVLFHGLSGSIPGSGRKNLVGLRDRLLFPPFGRAREGLSGVVLFDFSSEAVRRGLSSVCDATLSIAR